MFRRPITAVLLSMSLLFVSEMQGQVWDRLTTPTVEVSLRHAPSVRVPLDQVAFAPSSGRCAEELADAVLADFNTQGITVADRSHMENILAEHRLSSSGLIDEKTAARIGKLLGAGALIFIKVHDCSVSHSQQTHTSKDKKGNWHTSYTLSTRAILKGAVQTINMTAGTSVGARVVDATIELQNNSEDSNDYPPEDAAMTRLLQSAATQIHQMFFAWTELRKLHFYKDNECGLATAFQLLRGSDVEGAAQEAHASLDRCKTETSKRPATLAHAYYNAGMTDFMRDDYDTALDELGQAARLSGGSIITDAMTECRRAKALSQEMNAYQAMVAPAAAPSTTSRTAKPAVDTPPVDDASTEERLQKLDNLRKKKLITEEEYKAKRAEILKNF